MREIKFRGLIPDSGEISMVQSISFEEDEIYFSEHGGYCFDIDDCNLMQFTGLTDKNGVELYAGDVVYLAGYGEYVCEFPFIELYEGAAENDIGALIGNIYQNPELIENNNE
tara:strand:+ start:24381 stop:24716 length:336 start_codon:yes stop_codon:yes gene_type:complete